MSYHRTVLSSDADINSWGFVGEKVIELIKSSCPSMTQKQSPAWIFHKQIEPCQDAEAIAVQSGEMETERTRWLWPWKVLITPPVWTSQSLTIISSPPDADNIPSSEKVRALTKSVCPERTATWLPVIPSRMIMSKPKPIAMVSFQYARENGLSLRKMVRKHVPHSARTPLTILSSCEGSAL